MEIAEIIARCKPEFHRARPERDCVIESYSFSGRDEDALVRAGYLRRYPFSNYLFLTDLGAALAASR